ncbi:TonB-dependent siderophore receptor [Pseudoroseomonas cervicalis]|uniref:TonB-dependent siderophore receptor n=1 Tax=Teichococcus cervicalis TaxID=204525 RepID=UPI0022F1DA12|nr:TonB-dependent siderophore receptor [Pseudoroseomonas cervicalis]WBV45291.1 TonB-dependent siderophore receptor [Pseudoroseomonas cervicalis]
MIPTFPLRSLLLASAALSVLGLPAAAQTSPAAEAAEGVVLPNLDVQATAWRAWEHTPGYVAPVTTTGSKTDTPLIEAPQSVGVVTRDQIDDQAPLSVSQALRYTAGVLPEVRPSARYDSVFVRGFGGQGTGAAFVNFLDGLRQGRGLYFGVPATDPWLLERIEVLRGPASVLYGQTGVGGLVNLVSRRPSADHINEVRLEAGSNALMQTAFDLGGKLTEDGRYTYRLTGIARTANTQYDHAEEERIAIAPAITWRPDDSTTLTVLASYQNDPRGGFYNFVPATGSALPNRNGRLPRSFFGGDPAFDKYTREQAAIGYQLEHRLDDVWTLRQNFRYSHIDAEVNVISIRSVAADGRTATRSATFVSDHANAFALDNQAQASFSTGALHHTALFGIDWQRTSARGRQGLGSAPTLDIFAPVYQQYVPAIWTDASGITNQNLDQLGFYAQDQVALGRWRFNVGLRYDRASIGTTTHQSSGADLASTSQHDDELTWRVGALYLFDNGLAPYASYSTSFLPNTGLQAPQRGAGTFDPTTGEQYEVGVKFQPPGMNSFVQLAAFHITQQNVLTRDPVYTTYSVTQGEIRSRGIELEGRASLSNNLDLLGAYSYIDAEITKSNNPGVAGSRVPQVPNHIASGWANYRFLEGPLRGLSIGGGARYLSATYGNDTNTFKVGSATLFDAALRYDLGARFERAEGVELAVNASNIADKDYVASCSSASACYYGTGRMILGSVRARW